MAYGDMNDNLDSLALTVRNDTGRELVKGEEVAIEYISENGSVFPVAVTNVMLRGAAKVNSHDCLNGEGGAISVKISDGGLMQYVRGQERFRQQLFIGKQIAKLGTVTLERLEYLNRAQFFNVRDSVRRLVAGGKVHMNMEEELRIS